MDALSRREERLRDHLELVGSEARSARIASSIGFGALGIGFAAATLAVPEFDPTVGLTMAGVLFAAGGLFYLIQGGEEILAREYSQSQATSAEERERRSVSFERRFEDLASQRRTFRIVVSALVILFGLAYGALAVASHPDDPVTRWANLALAPALISSGLVLILTPSTAERAWSSYRGDAGAGGSTPQASARRAPVIGIAGHF